MVVSHPLEEQSVLLTASHFSIVYMEQFSISYYSNMQGGVFENQVSMWELVTKFSVSLSSVGENSWKEAVSAKADWLQPR